MSEDTESRYEQLKVPEFKSMLPPHVAARLSESDRYLVDSVSRMEQQTAWLTQTAVETNKAVRDVDKRVDRLTRWRDALTSKWSLIAGVLMLFVPVIVKAIVEHLLKSSAP